MKTSLISFLILLSFASYAQTSDDAKNLQSNRIYKLTDFRFAYSGTLYNYNSVYLEHAHDLWDFTAPTWPECDSLMEHDNRSGLYAGITFRKQLRNNESYFYGNINLGIIANAGGRIKTGYKYDYSSHYDSAMLDTAMVTNLDTLVRYQHDYVYKSTDIGFDISYTLSSPPNNIFRAETGLGFSVLASLGGSVKFTDTYSVNYQYRNQYNRNQSFTETVIEDRKIKPISQTIIRAYIPIILTYRIGHNKNFAITTSFSGGLDFQKPTGGNFYSYPFFSIGVGARWMF